VLRALVVRLDLVSILLQGSALRFELVSMSWTTLISPETASASFRFRRFISDGLSSGVRKRSENRNVSAPRRPCWRRLRLQNVHAPGGQRPPTWETGRASRVNQNQFEVAVATKYIDLGLVIFLFEAIIHTAVAGRSRPDVASADSVWEILPERSDVPAVRLARGGGNFA